LAEFSEEVNENANSIKCRNYFLRSFQECPCHKDLRLWFIF